MWKWRTNPYKLFDLLLYKIYMGYHAPLILNKHKWQKLARGSIKPSCQLSATSLQICRSTTVEFRYWDHSKLGPPFNSDHFFRFQNRVVANGHFIHWKPLLHIGWQLQLVSLKKESPILRSLKTSLTSYSDRSCAVRTAGQHKIHTHISYII